MKKSIKYNSVAKSSDEIQDVIRDLVSRPNEEEWFEFKEKTKTSKLYAVREFGNMCLLMAFDRVLDYGEVLNVPQADERNRKVERKEVMLFDRAAYREAIINSFVHNLWVSGNAPMFTVFEDRIEILSRGTLAAGLTLDGFFAGESVPVNQRLSDIFMQLHISERSGRGVPKIVEVYGKNVYDFRPNSIVVTIPFNKLELDSQQPVSDAKIPLVSSAEIPPVSGAEIPPVSGAEIPPVSDVKIPPVSDVKIPPVSDVKIPPVSGAEIPPVADGEISLVQVNKSEADLQLRGVNAKITLKQARILEFCAKPRNIQEILVHLHYKDKKTVRRYLAPLIGYGRLAMTIPDKPNSSKQKYIAIK